MITRQPTDWRDLQNKVCEIFNNSGLVSETEKIIDTVRGSVEIDVFAQDTANQPTTTYLCECKHWSRNVTKTIVHSFRTVVLDYGANWGFIISSSGFQSGAYEAAKNSPIKLLTWAEFQELFIDRWMVHYFKPRVLQEGYPLLEYTEPINSRISRKAALLEPNNQNKFIELREKYRFLGMLPLIFSSFSVKEVRDNLPFRKESVDRRYDGLPAELLDAVFLQDVLNIYCKHVMEAIYEFDQVFGERA